MDKEAENAIEEARRIFEQTAQQTQSLVPAAMETTITNQEEPEEKPSEQQPEASIQEPQPFVMSAPEEGEVDIPRKKRHWLGIAGLILSVVTATVILTLILVPLLTPTASVTIIPAQAIVTTTATLQVAGRALSTVTLTQARTVAATGTGHQDAQSAQGKITFYNSDTQAQTIPAGTLLQTASGVQMVTNEDAYVPAVDPPQLGQATVTAHALASGPAGNIAAYRIYGLCCRANILAENTAAFTGGQDARAFQAVTQSDMDNAASALKSSLMQSTNATFRAQLQQNEALTPPDCKITPVSDHKAGEEGTQVNVTVTASCSAYAYQTGDVQAQATRILTAAASQQLGDGYVVSGDPHITVTGASASGSLLRLTIKTQGAMAYQFGQGELQSIKNHIAGMDKAEAAAWLARHRGVKAVSIDVSAGGTLPQDTNAIRCTLLYAA